MNLDAYTVRKAVPRILVAAIGINISIYICVAAVDIATIVGRGLGELLVTPFLTDSTFNNVGIEGNLTNGIAGLAIGGTLIAALIGTGGIIWAIAAGGAGAGAVAGSIGLGLAGILIPIMVSVGLIVLAIIFTLVIWQALIVFLTVISPVAIALFVLPGTEKYFKAWADLYMKTLMVFPIIAVIFAMSTVMASIILGTAGDSPDGVGLAKIIGAVIVVFAPLILIPFAFKLAGGAIGTVMNAGAARSASISQRAAKGYQNMKQNPHSFIGARHRRWGKDVTDARANMYNRGVRQGGIRGSLNKLVGGAQSDAKQAMQNKESSEYLFGINETGNDEYVRAATIDKDYLRSIDGRTRINQDTGEEEFMAGTGAWYSESTVDAAHAKFNTAGDVGAAHRLVLSRTKNASPEQQQMMFDDFLAHANSTGMDAGLAAGTWAGIAIPNQNMRADLRYSSIKRDEKTGKLVGTKPNAKAVLDHVATAQGYELASQQEGTFEAFADAYETERRNESEIERKLTAARAAGDQNAIVNHERELAQSRDSTKNARENLVKFIGDSTSRLSPEQRAEIDAVRASQGDEAADGLIRGYGGASSASWRSEQAARAAKSRMDAFDEQFSQAPKDNRDFSGGSRPNYPGQS